MLGLHSLRHQRTDEDKVKESIKKNIVTGIEEQRELAIVSPFGQDEKLFNTQEYINELEAEMLTVLQDWEQERLEFERAAIIRDKIEESRKQGSNV